MAPLPLVPGVCKLVIGGTYHDTQWLNIFHVHYSGGAPSNSNCASYLSAITSDVQLAYTSEMSVDNELTSLEITDLTSDTGATASSELSSFGTRSGDFNPANVAVCASMEIARRYRGGHPRKYFSWGTSGTFASGSTKDWDPGFITDCNAKLNTMLETIVPISEGSTNWDTVVNVSYRNAGAVRTVAVVDPILSAVCRPRVCSQRRRLGKVGG